MTQDDIYLIKWKQAGMKDEQIARKLSTSVQEVQRRWDRITKEVSEQQSSGYNFLCDAFTTLCAQYKLVGMSLNEVGRGLGELMTLEEIVKLLQDGDSQVSLVDVNKAALLLRSHAVILRRFIPSDMILEDGQPVPNGTTKTK